MTTVSLTAPPRLQKLTSSMPDDGAINMKLSMIISTTKIASSEIG